VHFRLEAFFAKRAGWATELEVKVSELFGQKAPGASLAFHGFKVWFGQEKARLIGVVAACIFKVLVAMEEVK
jgi:hypothetical protein